ncbi:MAG: nucleotidyltransferase family protein, partial [Anaerovoracaceae bacterium]
LVLELPFAFACNSAEYFGRGAMEILKGLGCVNSVSFGSELGDIGPLREVADFLALEPEAYRLALRKHLDLGLAFPKARELAVNQCLGLSFGQLLKDPNNILAIEYLKACGEMEPITIKRKGSYHDLSLKEEGTFIGARAIREQIIGGAMDDILGFLPTSSANILKTRALSMVDNGLLFDLLRAEILKNSSSELGNIFGAGEGIENKMKKEIRRNKTVEEFAMALKSKRYTLTSINRLLMQTLLRLKQQDLWSKPLYGRVLALSQQGGVLLRRIKKEELATIPMITNINRQEIPELMHSDILASDLYNLACGQDLYRRSDYVVKPFVK